MDVDVTGVTVAVIAAASTITVGMLGYLGIKGQARRVAGAVQEQMDTGNDKHLGETVHDIASMQEIMSTQLHTNTRELLGLSMKVDRLQIHHEAHALKLDDHLELTSELITEFQDRTIPMLDKLIKDHEGEPHGA